MQAYEFYAVPENGVIQIPEQYKNRITTEVKVIILEKKSQELDGDKINTKKKSDLLLPPTMNTKDWKFNREEANER